MNRSAMEEKSKPPPLMSIIFLWCRVYLAPLETLMLRVPGTAGRAYFGLAGLLSVFWLALFTIYTAATDRDADVMGLFFVAFLASALFHAMARARRKGARCHSNYMGDTVIGAVWPWLLKRKGDWWIKKHAEPVLLLLLCLPATALSVPLGCYLFLGAFAAGGIIGFVEERDRRMTEVMHDAVLEQRRLHELYTRYQEHGNE